MSKPKITTMTLNMPPREMKVLEDLAEKQGLSKTALMRQALRLYQMVHVRLMKDERMFWRDKNGKECVELIFGCMGDD